MRAIISLIILQLIYLSICMDQLHIRYEWKQMDFQFPTPEDREEAIENGTFIPENNVPMGLEVWGDRLFITILRWKHGVPSSLNYINLNDNSSTSPILIPYPSWAAHSDMDERREIIAPYRVRADRCDRLWVLDSGKFVNSDNQTIKYPPAFIVYDLKTDNLLRKYEFPQDQVKQESGFANIVVEDSDCDKTYVYAGDAGIGGIVAYSWEKNESWRITHHYFQLDPLACDYNVKGYKFTWTDSLFGLGISGPNTDNFSTVYFHPMSSFEEFAVSTEYLRNKSLADSNFDAFKRLGSRGPNAQSGVAFLHKKTGVLFYSLVNLNAVACWRTTNKVYDMKNQGRIYMNNETMIYPTDIKVDYNENLWVLSNRLPIWKYGTLDLNEVNFRVFSAPVVEAISHTACDITLRSDILDKFMNNAKKAKNDPNSSGIFAPLSFVMVVLISWLALILSK